MKYHKRLKELITVNYTLLKEEQEHLGKVDEQVLISLNKDRKESADLICTYKETYEDITGKDFETATVDDIYKCLFNNWWRWSGYDGSFEGSWAQTYKIKQVLNSSHAHCPYQKRSVIISELLNWLRSPQILKPRIDILNYIFS